MPSASRERRTGGVGRIGLLATLGCAAAMLALPAGAGATSTVISNGTTVVVVGTAGPDTITVRVKKGLIEIEDPGGIPLATIPPCERIDTFTVRCPPGEVHVLPGPGNDEVVVDLEGLQNVLLRAPVPFASGGGLGARAAAAPTSTLTEGGPGNDTIVGIGEVNDKQVGGGGKDTLMGGDGDDTQQGGGGRDNLSGQGGNDTGNGGGGNDKLHGGGGKDVLKCGGGRDDKGVGAGGKDKAKGCEEGKA